MKCDKDIASRIETAYGVKDYRYVGGAYGLTNEVEIMNEIYNNGPVVINFEPTFDFMYYSGGIYHSKEADWVHDHSTRPEWEKVDHSVLCYGWGESDG
jgi:cathepsin C